MWMCLGLVDMPNFSWAPSSIACILLSHRRSLTCRRMTRNLRSITLFFNHPQIRVHQESPPKSRKEWCLLLAPNTANQASNDARMG